MLSLKEATMLLLILTLQGKCDIFKDLVEVDLESVGASAVAYSYFGDHSPDMAFSDKGSYWMAGAEGVPQMLWIVFDEPIAITGYTFSSRTDKLHREDGPSIVRFWASNSKTCQDEDVWVLLYKKLTLFGIMDDNPSSREEVVFTNNHKYKCYGFEIANVPGRPDGTKWVSMSSIKFYAEDGYNE